MPKAELIQGVLLTCQQIQRKHAGTLLHKHQQLPTSVPSDAHAQINTQRYRWLSTTIDASTIAIATDGAFSFSGAGLLYS